MTGKSRWWSYDSTKQVAREKQARREQNVPFQSASIDQIKDRTHGRNRKVRRGS